MSSYGKLTRHVASFFFKVERHTKMEGPNKKQKTKTKTKNEGYKQEIKDPNKK